VSDKKEYRELCKVEEPTSPFSRDWWLDAVCGRENWDVAVVEDHGQIAACLPYHFVKRRGRTEILMPKLTPSLGPWVRYPEGMKPANRLSLEMDMYSRLIEALPPFLRFNQNFHYSVTNWLPFYWKGFRQMTRYTYVIDDLTDSDEISHNLRKKRKETIKKAEKEFTVVESDDLRKFYELNKQPFDKQDVSVPYTYDLLSELDSSCRLHRSRKMLFALDKDDQVHSALYLVTSPRSTTALMSGLDPQFKGDGSTSLLFWEALKMSALVSREFDFEGSMLRHVESVLRSFGGRQAPYFTIWKTDSRMLRTVDGAREVLHELGLSRKRDFRFE